MNSIHKCVDGCGKLGRILIGILFLVSGVGFLLNFEMLKGLVGTIFPFVTLVSIIVLMMKIGGGLSLILGIRVRLGSYVLILFTLLTIIFFHLKAALGGDPNEMVMALKDLAIIGGLLLVAKESPVEGGMCMGGKCMGKKCLGKKCSGSKEGEKCSGEKDAVAG